MISGKQVVGIVVAVIVVMIVAFALTSIQQRQNTNAAECAQMLAQIN